MNRTPSWVSSAQTDIGTVRKINEDDFFDAPQQLIWSVADGMGGHAKGDVASQLITSSLARCVADAGQNTPPQAIMECLQQVNHQLWSMARSQGNIIGSTVTLLMLKPQQAHCIWAGDSRTYRLRDGILSRLTRDHSQVEDMVEAGLISAHEAEHHPKANVITRAIGAAGFIDLAEKVFDLLPGDQFLLCSDGINKVISDNELAHFLRHTKPQEVAQTLINVALSRNAKDNITCIYVYNQHAGQSEPDETSLLDTTLPLSNVR